MAFLVVVKIEIVYPNAWFEHKNYLTQIIAITIILSQNWVNIAHFWYVIIAIQRQLHVPIGADPLYPYSSQLVSEQT